MLKDLGKKFESFEKKVNFLMKNKQATEKAECVIDTSDVMEHNSVDVEVRVKGGDEVSAEATSVQSKDCTESAEAEQRTAVMKGEKEAPSSCVSMADKADNVRELLEKK